MGGVVRMIDLHTHLLPGLDDGAKNLEESIQMCWISYKDGVRTIVATPHTLNGLYLNDRETILIKVQELNEVISDRLSVLINQIDAKTLRSNNPIAMAQLPNDSMTQLPNNQMTDFKILPGADVHLSEKTLSSLDEGRLMTVGDGKKYLFLEFPFQGIPFRAEEVLFQLMSRGIIPVITHPERNLEIGQRPQRYYEMIKMGCLGQVTAMSLTGEFGPRIRQISERLLRTRLIHFIASDAHSINGRPPILSEGVRAAEGIVGQEEAWKMVMEYPQAILEGRKPNIPEPLSP
jgi:protein-tyrosine phosphatase